MKQINDHPVIRSMERTGYPSWIKAGDIIVGYCKYCGRAIYEDEDYERTDWCDPQFICEDCREEDED